MALGYSSVGFGFPKPGNSVSYGVTLTHVFAHPPGDPYYVSVDVSVDALKQALAGVGRSSLLAGLDAFDGHPARVGHNELCFLGLISGFKFHTDFSLFERARYLFGMTEPQVAAIVHAFDSNNPNLLTAVVERINELTPRS